MYRSVAVLPITGLSPGDLVFSEISDGHAGHVGLYMGGGQVVEEPHPGDHEKIVPLTTYGWQAAGQLQLQKPVASTHQGARYRGVVTCGWPEEPSLALTFL